MVRSPQASLVVLAGALLLSVIAGTADARPKKKKRKVADQEQKDRPKDRPKERADEDRPGAASKPAELDFTGINFEGRLRTPQLLYFLDRAAEELERASLERRSFIPAMVRSIDEEDL